MNELKVNPKFRDVIPPLTAEEYNNLRESIIAEGCRDAIIVWDGVIVDGHHRYAICQELGIPFNVSETIFDDEDEAILWIAKNQVSRRNLSDVDRGRIALKLKDKIMARAKEKQCCGINQYSLSTKLSEASTPIDTRKELAKIAGLSEGTLAKIERVDNEAPMVISDAMGNTISINKAAVLTKRLKNIPEAEREDEARAMLQVEFERKFDRICREEKVCKIINGIVAAAIKNYGYITEENIEIYTRRFPLSVSDIMQGIDREIELLLKIKEMFRKLEVLSDDSNALNQTARVATPARVVTPNSAQTKGIILEFKKGKERN